MKNSGILLLLLVGCLVCDAVEPGLQVLPGTTGNLLKFKRPGLVDDAGASVTDFGGDIEGMDYATVLDTHTAFSDSFTSTWTDTGGGVYTNENGWVAGGGADVSTPGEVFMDDPAEYLISPQTTNGYALTLLDEDHLNGNIYVETSSDKTNWVAGASSGSNMYVRITYTYGPPMGYTPYVTIYSAIVSQFDRPSLVGESIDFSGQIVSVDYASADNSPVPLRQFEEAATYTDTQIAANNADPSKALLGSSLQLGDYSLVGVGLFQGVNWTVEQTNSYIGTRFGDHLITLTSGLAAVEVQSISVSGTNATIELYVQNITGSPTVEITDDLDGGTWTNAAPSLVDNGDGDYTATVDITGYTTGFFRSYGTADDVAASEVEISAGTFDIDDSNFLIQDMVTTNVYRLAVSNGVVTLIQQ